MGPERCAVVAARLNKCGKTGSGWAVRKATLLGGISFNFKVFVSSSWKTVNYRIDRKSIFHPSVPLKIFIFDMVLCFHVYSECSKYFQAKKTPSIFNIENDAGSWSRIWISKRWRKYVANTFLMEFIFRSGVSSFVWHNEGDWDALRNECIILSSFFVVVIGYLGCKLQNYEIYEFYQILQILQNLRDSSREKAKSSNIMFCIIIYASLEEWSTYNQN